MNEINVKFDLNDLEKLQECSCFINNWEYSKHEHPKKTEWGKIEFLDLIIRFHAQPERSKREDLCDVEKCQEKIKDDSWKVCEYHSQYY